MNRPYSLRNTSSPNAVRTRSNKNTFWKFLIVLWMVFIVISQVPFLAENLVDTSEMDDVMEYHLSFTQEGKTGHYYVERYNQSQIGRINVKYTTKSNSLDVECFNIKVLKIYCREMYEDKSEEVFKRDPELDNNYYKTYFIERDHFQVHVNTEKMLNELTFFDTPIPYNVTVNDQEWWLTDINYTYKNDGVVITKVPVGHTYVHIYFKSNDKNTPVAQFSVGKTVIGVGESITFNASSSYDPDGEIVSYVWDLAEGSYKIGVTINHTFQKEGKYNVILTVKDDDYLIDRAFQEITVVQRVMSAFKSVDKIEAIPGSFLNYTITQTINSTWKTGVRDIVITDTIPAELEYIDAIPVPKIKNNTFTWTIGIAFETSEFTPIKMTVAVKKDIKNTTIISNYVEMDYKGIEGVQFPKEQSNTVITIVNVEDILTPRIRPRVSNVELQEDDRPFDLALGQYEYDFHDSGADLKWYITGENESLYHLSGENSENDIITIVPIPDAFGDDLVTLWLEDSDGYSTNQSLWINITSVNDNPIFLDAPDLILHYDDIYSFDYEPYIFDIDSSTEQLQLSISENIERITDGDTSPGGRDSSDGKHVWVDDFIVTYRYPKTFLDKLIFVSLVISDGDGEDREDIQINVTDDYAPELIKELPDVELFEGETKVNVFDLDDYFTDPDADSLFYSFGETHVSVVVKSDHTVDITSNSDWNGIDTITFRARDWMGALAEDTILVTVRPINDPPVFDGVPDTFVVHYNSDYSFDLTPYVSDKDNATEDLFLILTDKYVRPDPRNPLIIIMNFPIELVGLGIQVSLVVSDGIDTGSQSIIVKVTEYWPPDVLKELPDVLFYEDEIVVNAFNLNEHFSDKDSNKLYYSYGQQYIKIAINSDGTVDFTAVPNWYGVEIVTFRATDPTSAFKESTITVTVVPVNDAPTIKPLPDQNGVVNQLLKINLTDFIEDVDNDFSELTIITNTETMDIMISGKQLLIYSESPVIEDVQLIVSDGTNITSETLHIEIREQKSESAAAEASITFLMSILWILILVIFVIISIAGFVGWQKYYGNFIIEEIFWINNDGILITHISTKKTNGRPDEDLVSGMLTGIKDFTQDAFTDENTSSKGVEIKEIQMNEKNILVEKGHKTFLATVFSGRAGIKLYSLSRNALKSVEEKYRNVLESWKGIMDGFEGSNRILKSILLLEPAKLDITTIKQPQIQRPIVKKPKPTKKRKKARKTVRVVKTRAVQPSGIDTSKTKTLKVKMPIVQIQKVSPRVIRTKKIKKPKNKMPGFVDQNPWAITPGAQVPRVILPGSGAQNPHGFTSGAQTSGGQTPVVRTPVIRSPTVQRSVVQTPNGQTPEVRTPVIGSPTIQRSVVQTPNGQTPEVRTPIVRMPVVQTPSGQTPKVKKKKTIKKIKRNVLESI